MHIIYDDASHCHHIDFTCYTLKVMFSHLLLAFLFQAVTAMPAAPADSKDKVQYIDFLVLATKSMIN